MVDYLEGQSIPSRAVILPVSLVERSSVGPGPWSGSVKGSRAFAAKKRVDRI